MDKTRRRTGFKLWVLSAALTLFGLFMILNFVYQLVKKPSEIIGLFDSSFYKTPTETWNAHRDSFQNASTAIITPELLAALSQVESQGNSVARTFWRFSPTADLRKIYAPASSATGILQITDSTFEESKSMCIVDGKVAYAGRCWLNFLYSRLIPSHAVELTSAYLHHNVTQISKHMGQNPTIFQQQGA